MKMTENTQEPSAVDDQATAHVPLLSVTVLNCNYAHYLPQCLDSILRQTFTDFELLLINDRSTDNSLEVIQPYLADPRVMLIDHEQNRGYIASLIEGSDRSRGKYLTVISADDFCVSDRAFASLVGLLEANPDAAWAHSAFGIYDTDGEFVGLARHHDLEYVRPGAEEYSDLLMRQSYVLHSGTLIRASAYQALGGYDRTTRYACDTKMWLMLCNCGLAAYCPDELFAYRKHAANMSLTTGGIRRGLQEHLAALESSYYVMRGVPGIDRNLYVHAMKRNLVGNAEDAIFSGHLLAGWLTLWCAARLHPIWTMIQTRTAILLLRTLVGARGFSVLQAGTRYVKGWAKRRLALAV
jgi:glycosyltransferase involved in cell wall biosynthesis